MKYFGANIWLLMIAFLIIGKAEPLMAQDEKEKLQKNKESIEKEIALTTKLLEDTRQNRKASLNELVLINKKIQQRQRLINNIEAEVYYLNNAIIYNQKRISELENKLEKLRSEYAKMIQAAQKNTDNMTRLMYIFASENFNQAIKRMEYFRQYGHYRREQSLLIENTQDSIKHKNDELRQMRQRKISLKSQQENEHQNMVEEKQEKNKTVQQLEKKEKELLAEIRRKEKAAKELQRAIEKVIADEIARSAKAAEETDTDAPTIKRTFDLTPDQAKLSDNFAANRGKLPWPTAQGVVSSTFGEHPHAVLKYIKTNNNGIDILTSSGEKARAVFDGKVTNIISMPNAKKAVIVRHGEYLSVYSNLQSIDITVGQEVTTKSFIGTIFTDNESNKTELHFEIWKGKNLQNPSYWLAD